MLDLNFNLQTLVNLNLTNNKRKLINIE